MKKIFIYTYLLLISCSDFSDNVIGTWIQDDDLYNQEVAKLDKPMGNLSEAFGEIKLVFNADSTYKSYFDGQLYVGKWKIENGLFYMKRSDASWLGYQYRINGNELFIYDDPWLMALIKK